VSECRGFAHEPRPLLHMRCSASASPNCPSGNDDEYSGTNRETDARCRFRSGRLRPPPKVPRLRAFSECGEREVGAFEAISAFVPADDCKSDGDAPHRGPLHDHGHCVLCVSCGAGAQADRAVLPTAEIAFAPMRNVAGWRSGDVGVPSSSASGGVWRLERRLRPRELEPSGWRPGVVVKRSPSTYPVPIGDGPVPWALRSHAMHGRNL